MTNAEAEHQARDLLDELHLVNERLNDTSIRVWKCLGKLLDQVHASHRGHSEPDEPLGVAWSLYDISLLELVRTELVPKITGRLCSSDEEIAIDHK